MAYTKVSSPNGADYFYDLGGADVMDGGDGRDTVYYTNAPYDVWVSLSNPSSSYYSAAGDALLNIEDLYGSNYSDFLYGSSGPNTIYGLAGNDRLLGMQGNDELYGGQGDDIFYGDEGADLLVGGEGEDLAIYLNSPGGVNVNLTSATGRGYDAQGDVLSGIENIWGSASYDDFLRGDANANLLFGSGGNDVLIGEGGNDILYGGLGSDILHGGPGNDQFCFGLAFENESVRDYIADFDQNGNDTIIFDSSGFGTQLNYGDLHITSAEQGASTLITAAGLNGSIMLRGTTPDLIAADDFQFI